MFSSTHSALFFYASPSLSYRGLCGATRDQQPPQNAPRLTIHRLVLPMYNSSTCHPPKLQVFTDLKTRSDINVSLHLFMVTGSYISFQIMLGSQASELISLAWGAIDARVFSSRFFFDDET